MYGRSKSSLFSPFSGSSSFLLASKGAKKVQLTKRKVGKKNSFGETSLDASLT
jgi:hypothetical protein